MSLTREGILGFKDTRIGRVEVEEMGGEVCIASLTVAEADRIKAIGDSGVPAVIGLVILAACDESGQRLFTDADAEALSQLPASALGKVASAILTHNGLGSDDPKNGSGETATDVSGSASPLPSDEPLAS